MRQKMMSVFILFFLTFGSWKLGEEFHWGHLSGAAHKLAQNRNPASQRRVFHSGKVGQVVFVHLDLAEQLAADSFRLRGRIGFLEEAQSAQIVWQLPPGVSVLNGDTDLAVNHPESEMEVDLLVQTSDPDNLQVHLKVEADILGQRLVGIGQYDHASEQVRDRTQDFSHVKINH